MPRLKKKVDTPVMAPRSRELPETLTAGRARRTIKPNPKYMNDEMLIPSTKPVDETELSEDEYIVDFEENDDPEDSGMVIRKSIRSSTPQTTDGQPRRRGRPPKPKPLDAPRTEPIKNLRKEVLKKMDYKTISISKTRHMGSQLMHDGRRKLNLTIDSVESDSADQEEIDDDTDVQSMRSQESLQTNRASKLLNADAFKKQLTAKIIDRRGSVMKKGSIDIKATGGGTTEDDEYEEEDDDDFMPDSDAKTSEPENVSPVKRLVGRPRKHPVKQISPYGGKILLPGMKTATPSTTVLPVLKRKALEMDTEDAEGEKQTESQQSKMLRRSYGLKSVNAPNQSREVESDEQEEEKPRQQQQNRTISFPTLPRPGLVRPQKSTIVMGQQQSKQDKGPIAALGGNRLFEKMTKSPTITIVNVNDIMKMKSKGSTDIRRKMMQEQAEEEEDRDSEDVSEMEEMQGDRKPDGGQRTNNQLVASILERKRPVALENLQDVRKRVRETATKRSNQRSELPPTDEIVDFEDMLQKNIVSANQTRMVTVGAAARGRGRPPTNTQKQDENYSGGIATKGGRYTPNNRATTNVVSTRRSLQPPRILNATMKLGDRHPNAKPSSASGNNHYSIDLTDPDNNVKLVSSSTEASPVKKSPITASQYAQKASGVAAGTTKPVMGRVVPSSTPQDAKKRRVTCYETWNVIHIKSIDSTLKSPTMSLTMMALANVAEAVKLPSDEWSLRTVLERRKGPPPKDGEVYRGPIEDNKIKEEEKDDYEPTRIMFRRKAPTPGRFNVQFDRTVSFRNDTYTVNVDGQSCRLMAAPNRLETLQDIETLLKIVDYVDLKHSCVAINSPTVRRVASSKDAVIL
uniref:Uncharacterized protein n=1 Tax=Anopheles dirus TaxID=7168 RepID=A0A182NRG8_9DIPT